MKTMAMAVCLKRLADWNGQKSRLNEYIFPRDLVYLQDYSCRSTRPSEMPDLIRQAMLSRKMGGLAQ